MVQRLSRRQVLVGVGAAAALTPVLGRATARADDGDIRLLRWDLLKISNGVVVAGGSDVAKDAATGDTITMTGSGHASERDHEASGGGTFVHQDSAGTVLASGVYFVTKFKSFRNGHGSLVGAGLTDGIGELDETNGGILAMNVHLIPDSGTAHDGVLTIHCELPGATIMTKEGITLTVEGTSLNFVQDKGNNLFHNLDDEIG